ncbi:MAG: DUF4271 domain-containing protein [Bacteroidetes bacterium]|nr:MAG: DUF4271 domain-containing protein [Bacteroidota bacterium]REK04761.1 MAG: DUF4271 domain-containing protein [Bacteroidota bacterium]REK36235.1 MAG: DUF4271 domain-containing protein [Bacteroidota bacterium]REK51103.1 MAG: DUF4271 domain-containing protein [Bacteroidota bacterium]
MPDSLNIIASHWNILLKSSDNPESSGNQLIFPLPARSEKSDYTPDFYFNQSYTEAESGILSSDQFQIPHNFTSTDLYKSHRLEPVHNNPMPRESTDNFWIFPSLLLIIGTLAWLRFYYSKYFNQLLKAFYNINLSLQLVRDENILVQRASLILTFTFHLIAALFLYQVSINAGWELGGLPQGFYRYIFIVLLVSAAYTLKFLVLKITGWLFDLDREMATYIFHIFLINNVLGLLLLPFIALMTFNPQADVSTLITACIWTIGIFFIYRIFRGILTGMSVPGFSVLYLFLYLCTLEIAPLLVLIRIIIQ